MYHCHISIVNYLKDSYFWCIRRQITIPDQKDHGWVMRRFRRQRLSIHIDWQVLDMIRIKKTVRNWTSYFKTQDI